MFLDARAVLVLRELFAVLVEDRVEERLRVLLQKYQRNGGVGQTNNFSVTSLN